MEIQTIKITEQERELISGFIGEDIGSEVDYNRLIPVVQKIKSDMKNPCKTMYAVHTGKINLALMNTEIEAVRLAVVEFVDWFNKNY